MADESAPTEVAAALRGYQQRRRRWLVVLALVALTPIVLVIIARIGLARKVDREIAAIRARGEPVEYADFIRDLPAPTAEQRRAVTLYQQAFAARVVLTQKEQEALPLFGNVEVADAEPFPTAALAAAEDYLAQSKSALELLHEAIPLGPPVLAQDFTEFNNHVGVYSRLISAAELLVLQAAVAAEKGDGTHAAAVLADGWALSDHLDQLPYFWIAHLVRIALRSLTVQGIERVVNRTALTDAQLAALMSALNSVSADDIVRLAFSERAHGVWSFPRALDDADQASYYFGDTAPRSIGYVYKAVGLYHCDLLAYLRYAEQAIAISRRPMPQGCAKWRSWNWARAACAGSTRASAMGTSAVVPAGRCCSTNEQ